MIKNYDIIFFMRIFSKLLVLLLFIFSTISSYAIEEVVLDIDGDLYDGLPTKKDSITDEEWYFDMGGKTLREKIEEIKEEEVNDIAKSHYLLEEILTKNFENSLVQNMHLFAYYRANTSLDFYPDDTDTMYGFNDIDVGATGKFKDGKTYYETRFRLTPQSNYSFLQFLPSNFYIASAVIPHHTIIIGNTRTATGYEGAKSSTIIPFIARSQISRNFGNIRKLGLRVKGNYDLIEYDLGGYSSDTYFQEFFPGAEFAGWITLKPLGKTNGKYGKLKIGSGFTAGQHDTDYTVMGAYASYEYKKLYANFEWGKANGYNGAKGLSSNHAEGFYTTLGYRLTPKLQWVARYDQYRPNLDVSNNTQKEYSTGFNYFIKGQALKLMLNYVYCNNESKADSHRIILGTQILL